MSKINKILDLITDDINMSYSSMSWEEGKNSYTYGWIKALEWVLEILKKEMEMEDDFLTSNKQSPE